MNPGLRNSAEPQSRKKPNYKVRYCMVRQQVGTGSYGDYPGDAGLIIPKLLGLPKDEFWVRMEWIREYRGKDQFECGECGHKFTHMELRDRHYIKRHKPRRFTIQNLEDLTEEQRQGLKQSIAAENEKDPGYRTSPTDFHIPDPEDAELAAEEKFANETAPIHWDKTKASRK